MIYRGYDIIETKTNVGISSFTIMQNDKRIANGGTITVKWSETKYEVVA